MKISSQTLQVLKNYASINPNLSVDAGNALNTISTNKNILAKASVAETFPVPFAIYDLSQFLGIVSIFDDPDFTFNQTSVTIASGNKSIEYFYAAPEVIVAPSANVVSKISVTNPEIPFQLSSQQLNEVLKAASILQLEDICVVSDNGNIKVVVADPKNPSSNKFSIDVGTGSTADLTMIIKAENLKIINGDYDVQISSAGISKFTNQKFNIDYYIGVNSNSRKKG